MKRLIGLLGWIGVALVVTAVVLRFSRPEWAQWSQRTALAGLIVTLLYSLTQWRDIAKSFGHRGVKYGSVAATSVVLVLGILVGLNWISNRQNKRWDLTTGGQFSLSDQTRQLVSSLSQPVNVKAFYVGSADAYRDRLEEYQYLSDQVKVEYIDAEGNPLAAKNAGVTAVPTFVLEYGGRSEKATSTDEQAITNALKKVIEGKAKKIYMLQGHGEHNPDAPDSEGGGYSRANAALRTDNFDVAPLTLAQAGKIPEDANVILIAGPKTDLLAGEVDLLKAYLGRGGKLFVMLDPPEKGAASSPTNLIGLLREWGIETGNDLVVDASGLGQMVGTDASVPIAMPATQHPITENFRVLTAFPIARSVSPIDGGSNGRTAQKLLETSPQSWAESDIAGIYATGRPERNLEAGDKAGPVSIAVAVSAPVAEPTPAPEAKPAEGPKPETRMVAMGDSDFASNGAIAIQGNQDLFLNAANWLAQQEDLIAIRAKDPDNRPITMTADQSRMVYLFSMLLVPALLFLGAISVWWRRR